MEIDPEIRPEFEISKNSWNLGNEVFKADRCTPGTNPCDNFEFSTGSVTTIRTSLNRLSVMLMLNGCSSLGARKQPLRSQHQILKRSLKKQKGRSDRIWCGIRARGLHVNYD